MQGKSELIASIEHRVASAHARSGRDICEESMAHDPGRSRPLLASRCRRSPRPPAWQTLGSPPFACPPESRSTPTLAAALVRRYATARVRILAMHHAAKPPASLQPGTYGSFARWSANSKGVTLMKAAIAALLLALGMSAAMAQTSTSPGTSRAPCATETRLPEHHHPEQRLIARARRATCLRQLRAVQPHRRSADPIRRRRGLRRALTSSRRRPAEGSGS